MKVNQHILLIAVFILSAGALLVSFQVNKHSPVSPVPASENNNPAKDSHTATDSARVIKPAEKLASKTINILLLGLDGRAGDRNPRCDAIHMITFNPAEGVVKITSIPRGTEIPVPGSLTETTYLSNSCHSFGHDFAIAQINKITGVKNDYLITAGFSQTTGILRILNLPTTPTLQYLRNRSLPLGDYQRSHNQALFLKDILIKHAGTIARLPKPILYLLYKTVDTDMDFETAYSLLKSLVETEIVRHPERIITKTVPSPPPNIKDMHYTFDQYLDKNWENEPEYKNYQANLENYLSSLISHAERLIYLNNSRAAFSLIKTPFIQRIWEQLDNERRNKYHYDLLRIYVMTATDMKTLPSLVLDYIAETEALKETEWQKKGEELLETISK